MNYLKKRSKKETLEILEKLSETCSQMGGPISKHLYQLVLNKDYLGVIDYPFDYSIFDSVHDLTNARQIQGFYSKTDFLPLGLDTKREALKSFYEAEEKCRQTNIRLSLNDPGNPDVAAVLYCMQRKISFILGDCPDFGSLDFFFGPGSDTVANGLDINPRVKLSSELECSINLLPVVGSLLEELPSICEAQNTSLNASDLYHFISFDTDLAQDTWLHYCNILKADESWSFPVTIAPARVAIVPKNSKTGRTIVVEPNLNKLAQNALGRAIRQRLLLSGLDLRRQKPNQDLACEGSINGNVVTLDITQASDCLARQCVWNLVRYDWACLLDQCRSPVVHSPLDDYKTTNGDKIPHYLLLEKFSSMGNGFTFELESLIFYSAALCVTEHLGLKSDKVRVYGDDIIIPKGAESLMIEVLSYLGFDINQKKSFWKGDFRESCGADFINGFDIRPYYLKSRISDRVLFSMHNWFIRHCEFRLAEVCKSFVYPHNILYGPDGYGDGHLIGDYSLRTSRTLKRRGFGGGVFDTYSLKKRLFHKHLPGDYVYPCYSIYAAGREILPYMDDSTLSDPNTVRGANGYAKISIYTLVNSIFTKPLNNDTV